MNPDGAIIAVGFSDCVLRFIKIVLKKTQKAAHTEQHYELVLFEAFKPHKNLLSDYGKKRLLVCMKHGMVYGFNTPVIPKFTIISKNNFLIFKNFNMGYIWK